MDAHFESILSSSSHSGNKPAFLQSDRFIGKRTGYVFKNGINGIGYYLDSPPAPEAVTLPVSSEPMSKRPRTDAYTDSNNSATVADQVDIDALLQQGEKLETLDTARLKHLIAVFDKKITSNQLMRAKYPSQPEKFMTSEIELHACIEELYAVAAYPDLYQSFVDCGGMKHILGMIAHENTDISLTSVGFLQELLDPDMILDPDNIVTKRTDEEEEEAEAVEKNDVDGGRVNIAMCAVDAFLEGRGLELLVQNLGRINETESEEDAEGVHNTMAILEHLMEILPHKVAVMVCERTHILKFLLLRLKTRPFDANKLYCSEILSILLLQTVTDGSNQRRLCRLHGVDGMETLLQCIHTVRKAEAISYDEQECIQNLFLCLSSVLDIPAHQQQFLESQGLELLLRCMTERKFAAVGATKTLKFALATQANCLHYVSINGLKFIFPMLMGHSIWKPGSVSSSSDSAGVGKDEGEGESKRNRKKALEEKQSCEESCIAVLAQLCLASSATPLSNSMGMSVGPGAAPGPGAALGPSVGPMREQEDAAAAVIARQIAMCSTRILAKFTENNYEKTERCAELYVKYAARSVQTEGRLAQLRLQLLADEDEESLEELDDAEYYYLQRCGGGLTQLQELAFVLMWVCQQQTQAAAAQHQHQQVQAPNGSAVDSSVISDADADGCYLAIKTKLAADRIPISHVLDTLREAVAHINVDEVEATLLLDQDVAEEDDEDTQQQPFAEDVRADNIETKENLLRKRSVWLNYSALFARRLIV